MKASHHKLCKHCNKHWLDHSAKGDHCPRYDDDGNRSGWQTQTFEPNPYPPGTIVVNGHPTYPEGAPLLVTTP